MSEFDDIYDTCYDGLLDGIYGETITYHRKDRDPKEVTAIIDREVPVVDESGMPTRVFVLTFKNSTNGVIASEVSKVNDYFMIEKRRGEAPRRVSVINIEDSTSGVTSITCR